MTDLTGFDEFSGPKRILSAARFFSPALLNQKMGFRKGGTLVVCVSEGSGNPLYQYSIDDVGRRLRLR